ncbi:hypothetical protein E2P81_ATG10152 [Venturia nashicola]|nr:hypothetical protein E2P81_ATG10152 [Venturia nashicola]
MPSIAESKRQVSAGMSAEIEHDAILASLQDEIDRHNRETEEIRTERPHKRRRRQDDDRERDRDSKSHRERHLRFRFKSGVEEPKTKKRSKRSHSPTAPSPAPDTAHPFPREPTDPDAPSLPSNTAAFQTSLFDALADDEAASYWESVYSQPIHVYARPVEQTASGELQDMDDETYAAYVQRKMWEKQNPEIMIERDRMERKRKEEKEAKERRREEFVRARQKEAWDHAGRARGPYGKDDDSHDDRPPSHKPKVHEPDEELYAHAWTSYLAAWDALKAALARTASPSLEPPMPPSKRIPWPTLQNRPATRPNIEAFMRRAPTMEGSEGSASRLQALKVERVRWHPDKVQQRFAGAVDEGTMKVVTGVFQVVDGLMEEERKKANR